MIRRRIQGRLQGTWTRWIARELSLRWGLGEQLLLGNGYGHRRSRKSPMGTGRLTKHRACLSRPVGSAEWPRSGARGCFRGDALDSDPCPFSRLIKLARDFDFRTAQR